LGGINWFCGLFLFILFNLIGCWKGIGRKIALFIPAATKIKIVAVFVYTSWYTGGYNGLIRVLFSRAVSGPVQILPFNSEFKGVC